MYWVHPEPTARETFERAFFLEPMGPSVRVVPGLSSPTVVKARFRIDRDYLHAAPVTFVLVLNQKGKRCFNAIWRKRRF